jgi:LPXTG-motif cell wall-anchored protein
MFVTSVGGQVYDAIAPTAPFVLVGLINALLAMAALWLLRKK